MEATEAGLEQRVRVVNTTGGDTSLWIEPLGERLFFPQDATFEIVAASDPGHEVEIEFTPEGVAVHGWVQHVSSVSQGGRRQLWRLAKA